MPCNLGGTKAELLLKENAAVKLDTASASEKWGGNIEWDSIPWCR